MHENWRSKPAGNPQRPVLKVTMGPALLELALKVTLADSADLQKAAKYVYELGLYTQSEQYAELRLRRNRSTKSSKAKRRQP